MGDAAASFFERIGGQEGCRRLTDAFYARVLRDPRLSALFPRDPAHASEHLALFIAELVGGPELYSLARGRPRMRRRHRAFAIGPREAEAWLEHMRAALDEVDLGERERDELWRLFELGAASLVNDPIGGRRRLLRSQIGKANPIADRHG
jgi:hemoglobin